MGKKPAQRAHWGVRSVVALLLFVIAAVLTPVAAVAHWGHRTVTDATQYIETVGPLVDSPEIQAAISDVVTQAIVKQVDTKALVSDALGGLFKDSPLAQELAAPLAAGVNGLIAELVRTFVASDAFRDIWIDANKIAQASLISLLEGKDNGPIQLRGDQVVLDVSSLLNAVKSKVASSGLTLAEGIQIPQSDTTIVLFESAVLGEIQFLYQLTAPILAWFPLIIAALFGLAIVIARNRPRTALATGIALIALSGVSLWLLDYAQATLVADISGTVLEDALTSFWATFFAFLLNGLWAMLLLGVIVALAGWYGGRSRPATAVREAVSRGLHSLRPAGGGLNTWVRSWAPFLRWTTVIVLGAVLTVGNVMEIWRVFWICALAAGIFTLIEMLNGPDRDAYAQVSPEEPAHTPKSPSAPVPGADG